MWLNRHANLHKYKHVLVRESILLSKYVYYHIIIIDVAQPTCAPIPMSTYDHHSIYIFISKWPYLYYYIVSVYTTLTIFILLYRISIYYSHNIHIIISHGDIVIYTIAYWYDYTQIRARMSIHAYHIMCIYSYRDDSTDTHTHTHKHTNIYIYIGTK